MTKGALVAAARRCIRFAALMVERIALFLILLTQQWRENPADHQRDATGEIIETVDTTKVGSAATVVLMLSLRIGRVWRA
jgi:hypothetical protein